MQWGIHEGPPVVEQWCNVSCVVVARWGVVADGRLHLVDKSFGCLRDLLQPGFHCVRVNSLHGVHNVVFQVQGQFIELDHYQSSDCLMKGVFF